MGTNEKHIFECAKSSLGARLVAAKSLNEMFVLKGLVSYGEAMRFCYIVSLPSKERWHACGT